MKLNYQFFIRITLITSSLILTFSGCSEDDNNVPNQTKTFQPQVPIVETVDMEIVGASEAVFECKIQSNGLAEITTRGVCWSKNTNPTISDSKVETDNEFSSNEFRLSMLLPNTQYFIRAFATNSIGTAYGETVSFTTKPASKLTVITKKTGTSYLNSAVWTGYITDFSYEGSIEYGLCWSENQNPTLADFHTASQNYISEFSCEWTGLTSNTTYHVRAYATTDLGTTYGNDVAFTTLPENGQIVEDIDGNIYHTVTIGSQVWLLENLKTTKFNDGTPLSNITNNSEWITTQQPAYCWYKNQQSYKESYGALYNGYVVDYLRNGGKNIAPTGWHVPSSDELGKLCHALDPLNTDIALKESGTAHWAAPNSGATNISGFTALPGGFRGVDAIYGSMTESGYWWSTSPSSGHDGDYLYLLPLYFDETFIGFMHAQKSIGLSIRCIKD